MTTAGVLFASRAYESPDTEGGFVHLKDIAVRAAHDDAFVAMFLSCRKEPPPSGVVMTGGFSRPGWGRLASWQFVRALSHLGTHVNLVHTAHVPTPLNSRILARISRAGRRKGVRFVQTVTALPRKRRLDRRLFWGDAVTCLNESVARLVSRHHDNVRTIAPVPAPQRLAGRSAVPPEISRIASAHRLLCVPIELSRVDPSFSLKELCVNVLEQLPDTFILFACRFGDERRLRRQLSRLPASAIGRTGVVGPVNWILELFRAAHVVAYPVASLEKKFNPPLVILEAAHLGSVVVVPGGVEVSRAFDGCQTRCVEQGPVESWVEAIKAAFAVPRGRTVGDEPFERCYQQYRALYRELLTGS